MSLRQVVDFLTEGAVVELFNHSHRIIYRLKSVPSTSLKVCNVVSVFGNLLDDDEWPWYIKSHFKEDLEEIQEIPSDLPVENYKIN